MVLEDVKPGEPLPPEGEVAAYRWEVVLVLCGSAATFCLPSLLWRLLAAMFRVPLATMGDAAQVWTSCSHQDTRNDCSLRAAYILAPSLNTAFGGSVGRSAVPPALSQCRVIILYMVYLCLNTIVAVTNFSLLDRFLCSPDSPMFYGFHALREYILHNEDLFAHTKFPQMVLCDFQISHQARTHSYVTQCFLPIHGYLSAVLLLLWVYLCAICAVSIGSLLHRVVLIIFCCQDFLNPVWSTMRAMTPASDGCRVRDDAAVRSFLSTHGLGPDGCFVLTMMSNNVNGMFAAEVCQQAWLAFQNKQGKNRESSKQAEMCS